MLIPVPAPPVFFSKALELIAPEAVREMPAAEVTAPVVIAPPVNVRPSKLVEPPTLPEKVKSPVPVVTVSCLLPFTAP